MDLFEVNNNCLLHYGLSSENAWISGIKEPVKVAERSTYASDSNAQPQCTALILVSIKEIQKDYRGVDAIQQMLIGNMKLEEVQNNGNTLGSERLK